MKRTIATAILIFAVSAFAQTPLQKLYDLYNAKRYKEACQTGLRMFTEYKKDSRFLMLYGLACLKSDYIDRLAVPMTGLRHTKTERANASYFATIILQKKLLYHALIDGVDISHLRLPKTDYILSKVFDMYTRKVYKKVDDRYYFEPEGTHGLMYVLYITQGRKAPIMVIEERLDDRLIKTHRYW